MPVLVRGSTFTPAPEGVWDAVCVDVDELGEVETQWGKKEMIRLAWELREKMDDGRPYIATKRYTSSLNEKSTLHKDLKSWRGRAFTAEEIREFDVEAVLFAPCRLVIQQVEKDGSIYANVVTVMKADPKSKITPSGTYIRHKDRVALGSGARTDQAPAQPDDEIPF